MTTGNITTVLEKASYVATPAEIKALTKEGLAAIATSVRSKTTYLKAEVATTINQLGLTPRQRSQGQPTKLSPEDKAKQLEALDAVHADFYAAVLEAIDEVPLSDEEKPKSGRTSANAIKTRRATFARTAYSTLRRWIKAGNDVSMLVPAKVTKASLAIHGGQKRKRATSPKRLVTRVEKQGKTFIASLLELAEADPAAATKEIQTVMGQLSSQLLEMGVKPTRDVAVAAAESRPYQTGKGKNVVTFVPTDSMVLRHSARAA